MQVTLKNKYNPDNTIDIINSYVQKDFRVKLYKFGVNSGAAVARNNSKS